MALVPDPSPKPASKHTRARNAASFTALDPADFDRARRGFVAALSDTNIADPQGRRVSDIGRYAFLADDAPDTVHPNLWRHAQLNAHHGLFESVECEVDCGHDVLLSVIRLFQLI